MMEAAGQYAKHKRTTALEIESQLTELIFQALEDIRQTRESDPSEEVKQAFNKRGGQLKGIPFGPDQLKKFIESYEKTDKITREEKKSPSYSAEEEGASGATLAEIVQASKSSIQDKIKEMLSGGR